jgi:hypothetical protein
MCNQNSDAQNNQKKGNGFEHRPALRNPFIKRVTFCTVKEIQLSEPNFPPRDDFEQHCAPCLECLPRLMVVPDLPASHRFGCGAQPDP